MTTRRRRRDDDDGSREIAELAALADGSLSPERRAALEARVAASPELADRLTEQERAIALAQSAADEVEAPAALRARIEARRRAKRAWLPRGVVLAGAALTAVLAVGIGVAALGSSGSAETFHAALQPTDLVPAASGAATMTKTSSGWRIELRATGLPRREAPLFYAAWLRNSAGVLVPIGTFNDGRDVTLWAGVSPKEFSTISVTRERADTDQDSSGERVLVGTVDTSG
ncbi:MAG TPA: anti-sigma factor [Gaiellaceae bacterium]|nr:anti-sigma factor [Gaiellaceae bacterium]